MKTTGKLAREAGLSLFPRNERFALMIVGSGVLGGLALAALLLWVMR